MAKKGELNPEWEFAAALAREAGNDLPANIKRFMRELKDVKSSGYSRELAVECWRWLRTREKFPIKEARLSTCFAGSPAYIEQFKIELKEAIPPVYEATAHDNYVLKNANALALLGFVYKAENIPDRLTTEQLVAAGLKGLKNED